MNLNKQYKVETGQDPIYRKNGADYHTLRYVRWLENRITKQENAPINDDNWDDSPGDCDINY